MELMPLAYAPHRAASGGTAVYLMPAILFFLKSFIIYNNGTQLRRDEESDAFDSRKFIYTEIGNA